MTTPNRQASVPRRPARAAPSSIGATRVKVDGIKGCRQDFELRPVTAFFGANGVGKTATVGSIAYALTGRFPGVGAQARALAALGEKHTVRVEFAEGSEVQIAVTRAFDGKASVVLAHQHSHTGKAAEEQIARLFGDAQWFIDGLDRSRSAAERGALWTLSDEKLKAWLFGICGRATNWTRVDLATRVGPKSDDWDPGAEASVADAITAGLLAVDARLRTAQETAREARIAAKALVTAVDGPTFEELGRRIGEVDVALSDAQQAHDDALRILGEQVGGSAGRQALRSANVRIGAAEAKWNTCADRLTELGAYRSSLEGQLRDAVMRSEHKAQIDTAARADNRATEIKALAGRIRQVRDEMLDETIEPVRKALVHPSMRALLPARAKDWVLKRSGSEFIVGYESANGLVRAEAISEGELVLLTLALQIATTVVKRPPWVAVFLDNFERVYPAEKRSDVLVTLVALAKDGVIDNAFVAGACDMPPYDRRQQGVRVYFWHSDGAVFIRDDEKE